MSDPSVAICIATHERPEGLAHLLKALDRQALGPVPTESVRILVTDNARSMSARDVCEAYRATGRFDLEYCREPRRGECFARNHAVAMADGSDFCAFIDDDEEPDPAWLATLVRRQQATGADIVCGPTEPRFLAPAPDWLRRSWVYRVAPERWGMVDLSRALVVAGTGNLLVRTSCLKSMGPEPFPTDRPLAGGTDRLLLLRLVAAGARLESAPEARVFERVPPERFRLRYLAIRAFGSGYTQMEHLRRFAPDPDTHRRQVLRAAVAVPLWSLCALVTCWSRRVSVDYLLRMLIHSGRLAQALGFRGPQRYRVTDGG